MTDIQQQAADTIEELLEAVLLRDAELNRIYEIAAILHVVAKHFLRTADKPTNEDEEEAFNGVVDAVRALEENLTMEQAKQTREEETQA